MTPMINPNEAKYLPNTICSSEIGNVISNSIEPVRFSSAKDRMVIAGIKITYANAHQKKKMRNDKTW